MAEAGTARAFWTLAPGRGEIREAPLPAPGPDDVLVQTLHIGISRGTESLVYRGRVPASQWSAMRCPFQEGDFPGPLKYGYASIGHVEASPTRSSSTRSTIGTEGAPTPAPSPWVSKAASCPC